MKKFYSILTTLLIASAFGNMNYAQSPLEFDQLINIGGNGDEIIRDVIIDSQGNTWIYLFSGSDQLFSNDSLVGTQSHPYLLKYDNDGKLEFSYEFITQGEPSVVFPDNLVILNNDHIVCTGYFSGDLIFGDTTITRAETTGFICKFSPAGTPEFVKCIEISQQNSRSHDVMVDAENNLFIAGLSQDTMFFDQNQDTLIISSGERKMPVWKYNSNFELQWLKVFHADEDIPFSQHITLDQDLNIVVAAAVDGSNFYYDDQAINLNGNSHKVLVKLNQNGGISWINSIDGESSSAYDICVDQENKIYFLSSFTGSIYYHDQTFTQVGNSTNQMYVLSLDQAGEFISCNQIHSFAIGIAYIVPGRITCIGNDIFVSGAYNRKTYFDDYLLEKVCPNFGRYDTFIAKLNTTTNTYAWANGIFGNVLGGFSELPVIVDEEHNVTAALYYSGNGIYGDTMVSGYGDKDILIARMKEVITGTNPIENTVSESMFIYPNPAGNRVFIKTDLDLSGCMVTIRDRSGKTMEILNLKHASSYIELSGYKPGIYIFNVTDAKGKSIHNEKVIRE